MVANLPSPEANVARSSQNHTHRRTHTWLCTGKILKNCRRRKRSSQYLIIRTQSLHSEPWKNGSKPEIQHHSVWVQFLPVGGWLTSTFSVPQSPYLWNGCDDRNSLTGLVWGFDGKYVMTVLMFHAFSCSLLVQPTAWPFPPGTAPGVPQDLGRHLLNEEMNADLAPGQGESFKSTNEARVASKSFHCVQLYH